MSTMAATRIGSAALVKVGELQMLLRSLQPW